MTITFAIFPVKNAVSVDYLIVCLWVVGILLWVVVIWAIASSVMALLPHLPVQRVRIVGPRRGRVRSPGPRGTSGSQRDGRLYCSSYSSDPSPWWGRWVR